jgi:epoxyqueuosine reductase
MGSYYYLFTLATDLPADGETWQEPQRMIECERCRACVKNCPTGCIGEDRDIILAEMCMTYFNESAEPFPDWIDKDWHSALIGCMRCQSVCPANKGLLKTVEFPDPFTEEEIGLLLMEKSFEALPEKARETLKELELEYAFRDGTLARNLGALLSAAEPRSDE